MKNLLLFNDVFRNKKVLLTGDTGFKGSWLSIWLIELGAEVYGYALPPKTKLDNFVKTELDKIVHHIDADVRDKEKLLSFFQEVQPDFAFHLAAQPLVIESYNNPQYTFETNLLGTVNFFEAVRKTRSVRAAINITSDKCYLNDERKHGYSENDPMGGKDPYSASKACSELITASYIESFFNKENTACAASVRAGNVIGGGDWAENRIVPDFFRAITKKEKLLIRYPYATRPWQHVLEPLSGYLLLAYKLFTEGKSFQGGWNFGPDEAFEFTVKQLVEKLSELTGFTDYSFSNDQNKFQEASLLKLNTKKAADILKWKCVLDFDETMSFTKMGYEADISLENVYDERIKELNFYYEEGIKKNISYLRWDI
ncbi:MAG: CDP-glucose 4,6-dehydratase [Ignavibacteriaceae bacterium]|nr:CDP-glucose 4,6-dehydratase [Ignavibacteriaceae bacterium]